MYFIFMQRQMTALKLVFLLVEQVNGFSPLETIFT